MFQLILQFIGHISAYIFSSSDCAVLDKRATGMNSAISNPLPFTGFTYTRKDGLKTKAVSMQPTSNSSGQAAAFCFSPYQEKYSLKRPTKLISNAGKCTVCHFILALEISTDQQAEEVCNQKINISTSCTYFRMELQCRKGLIHCCSKISFFSNKLSGQPVYYSSNFMY